MLNTSLKKLITYSNLYTYLHWPKLIKKSTNNHLLEQKKTTEKENLIASYDFFQENDRHHYASDT